MYGRQTDVSRIEIRESSPWKADGCICFVTRFSPANLYIISFGPVAQSVRALL